MTDDTGWNDFGTYGLGMPLFWVIWAVLLFVSCISQHTPNPVPALDPNNLPKAVPSRD
jgi:hypothetical protein